MSKNSIRKFSILFFTLIMLLLLEVNAQDSRMNIIEDNVISIEDINKVNKAGTYFVRFSVEDDNKVKHDEIKRVHIRFPKTVLNYDNNIGIDAHDIVMKTGTFNTLTVDQIVVKSGAHAWDMVEGGQINELDIEILKGQKHDGTINNVKFQTVDGTSVKVNVFEQYEMYMELDTVYMNQYPIQKDTFRVLSSLIIFLILIPIIIFIILARYINREKVEVENILEH